MKSNVSTVTKGILLLAFSLALWSTSLSQDNAFPMTPEGICPGDSRSNPVQNQMTGALTPDVWTPTGPGGITASAIAVDPQNSNIIYAGGLSGLYKTLNGGTNWQIVSSQILNNQVLAINLHPTNSNIVLAWMRLSSGIGFPRLMRSTDGGGTWTEVLTRNWGTISEMFFDSVNPDKMFTAADSVYASTDQGATWKSICSYFGMYAFAVSRQNSNVMYAKRSTSILKTTDGGQLWTAQAPGLPTSFFGSGGANMVISPIDQNTLFLANRSLIDTVGGFYRSTDGGVTWQRQIAGFGLSKSVNRICIDPSNSSVIYAGGFANGVYLSSNGGDTWTPISAAIPDHYVQSMAVGPTGTLYCTFGGSFHSTTNQGASWNPLNGDLENVDVFNVVMNPANANIMYAGTLGGIHRTSDGGTTWQQMNSGIVDNDIFALILDPKTPNTLYAGTYGGLVYKTTDAGVSWTEKSVGLPGLGRYVVPKLSLNSKNPNWIWVNQYTRSYQSTDGGATWTIFSASGRTVTEAIFDPQHPDTLYAAGSDTLYRTTNGGGVWTVRRSGVRLTNLIVDPTNPSILYADSSSRGTAKSTDAGLTWTRVDTVSSRDIYVNPVNPAFVYAATFGYGVRRSTNGGNSWSNYNNGNPCLSSFMVRSSVSLPHTLFCATFGGSLYRVDEVTSVLKEHRVLSKYFLNQNYPNPFNPSTIIEYGLQAKSSVRVQIFNILGERVATLFDGEQTAGYQKVQWNANVSSGIYFCRIDAVSVADPGNRFAQVKKMMLLK